VKDGIYFDYHVVAMLRHHLPLADEIIVNEGYSKDGTYEAIKDLDPKVKIDRNRWDRSDPATWSIKFKNHARQLCTGDWCILLDCDEFIPEWEFERLRSYLSQTTKVVVRVRFTHFYGNYKVHLENTKRSVPPRYGRRIHQNRDDIEAYGDGSTVRLIDADDSLYETEESFACHHFGEVRNPARLRHKWRIQAKRHRAKATWDRVPGFLFKLFPHKWIKPEMLDRLAIYEGPYIKAVRDDPDEFVRDDFRVYEFLRKRDAGRAAQA
jgi:glycosyltransferase involved in cell wall biosynthesis